MRLFFFVIFLGVSGYAALNAQIDFTSPLPILVIDTEGRDIPDEPKILARMRILTGTASGKEEVNYTGYVGIEERGSSSKRFPKKGYGLETRRETGADRQTTLLDFPREEDFVLHGPYSDKSLIRNALTYRLAGQMMVWAPRVQMVEMVLNDDYRGVYLLTENIKRDKQRVPVKKLEPDENSGDQLTGGYILKIDKKTGESARTPTSFASRYVDDVTHNPAVNFLYHYPEPKDITAEQRAYISNWIHDFEAALDGPDFRDPTVGYRKYIDLGSFIDFLLINELSRNVDGFRLSTYFYKEKDSRGGKLHMGPVWDFNLAYGNADYCRADNPRGWAFVHGNECGGKNWPIPFWWRRMLEDPYFCRQLADRWGALRRGLLSDQRVAGAIDGLVREMGAATTRNFDRWEVLGKTVWPNAYVGTNYEDEIYYLKRWCRERSAWMDAAIAGLPQGFGSSAKEH